MRVFELFCFISVILLTLSSGFLSAVELTVVDQDGNPLANAYVAIPQGSINTPSSKHAIMDQVDVEFVPHVLAIDKGQSVVFPNSDNIRHHVYSFSESKRFEIKLYQGVPKKPVLFDEDDLIALGCNIHDSMLGYILVSPWPEYALTCKSGKAVLEGSSNEIAVWHPWMKGKTAPDRLNIASLINNGKATISLDVTKPAPRKSYKKSRRQYYD